MRFTYCSCQATPLLPTDGVWWGECGHGGRHWDRDGHPVPLPTRGTLALLFICETQTLACTWKHKHRNMCSTLYNCTGCISLSHLGAGLLDWAEHFCAAPPDMVVGYKDETRCVAGAMEPDSEVTACSLYPDLTPLKWERRDAYNMLKGIYKQIFFCVIFYILMHLILMGIFGFMHQTFPCV